VVVEIPVLDDLQSLEQQRRHGIRSTVGLLF